MCALPILIPSATIFTFWEAREYSYKQKNWQKVNMVAEGIIDGKVVCTYKRMPSRRSTKLRMYVDTEGDISWAINTIGPHSATGCFNVAADWLRKA